MSPTTSPDAAIDVSTPTASARSKGPAPCVTRPAAIDVTFPAVVLRTLFLTEHGVPGYEDLGATYRWIRLVRSPMRHQVIDAHSPVLRSIGPQRSSEHGGNRVVELLSMGECCPSGKN